MPTNQKIHIDLSNYTGKLPLYTVRAIRTYAKRHPEMNRKFSRTYYEKNKDAVNFRRGRKRVVDRILKGLPVREELLGKYDVDPVQVQENATAEFNDLFEPHEGSIEPTSTENSDYITEQYAPGETKPRCSSCDFWIRDTNQKLYSPMYDSEDPICQACCSEQSQLVDGF